MQIYLYAKYMQYYLLIVFDFPRIRKLVNYLKLSNCEKICNSGSFRITSFILKNCRFTSFLPLILLIRFSLPLSLSLSLILSITQSQLCMKHQTSLFLRPPSSLPPFLSQSITLLSALCGKILSVQRSWCSLPPLSGLPLGMAHGIHSF